MKLARKIEKRNISSESDADEHVRHLVPGIKSFSKYMGFAVSLIGVLVISAWLFGPENLNNVFAGLTSMEANTAIAFIAAGLALWLRVSTNPKLQTAALVLGAITGLIGLLTLGEYLSGRNFGIDELIFKDLAGSGELHPGRMSFMSALSFTMLGMALLLIDGNNERRYNLAQSLTLVAGVIAYFALAGHIFDVDSLYGVGIFAPMAFHTALSFILLCAGIICAQPEDGWVGYLMADNLGGDLLRRLLPVAFVVPILLAWLRLQGQLAGLYETSLGTTLLAIAITLLLSIIIWFNAKGLSRADNDRRQAEEELRASEERFRVIVNQATAGIAETDLTGKLNLVNDRYCEIVGYERAELLKMRMQEITHEEDLPRNLKLFEQMMKEGTPFVIEKRYVRKDGSQVWVNDSVSAIRSAVGELQNVLAVTLDITESKQAENRLTLLAEISEFTRNLEDPNELLYVISKAIGEHLQVRRCLFNETDLENDREIVHRDYTNGVESVAGVHKLSNYSSITSAEMQAGKTVVNCDSKTDVRTAQDYEKTYAQSHERAYVAVPLMRENQWVGTFWVNDDVPRQWSQEEVSLLETVAERAWTAVEKLRVDTALRQSEERFVRFMQHLPGLAWIKDLEGRYVYANDAAEKAFSTPREQLYGKTDEDIFPAETAAQFNKNDERVLTEEMGVQDIETLEHDDGVLHYSLVSKFPIPGTDGNIALIGGTAVDITERKQAEEALQLARDQAEQTADRISRLQEVTAALSEALTPLQVAKIVVDQGAPALGAVSGTVMLLAEDGQNLEIVYSASPQPVIQPYQRFSISASVPAADAARSSQPVWIESREQYLERYPHLADQINLWGHQAAIAIPMFDKGRMLGVLALSFDNVLIYTPRDQDYILTLARQGAQALERARLYEAEQQARHVAIEFAQQQEALYKLTDQLQRTSSLDDVFNASLDAILGALQCDRASILLFDDSEVMHFVAWRGLSDNYRKSTDGHSPWTPDEKNAEPISINDVATGEISDSLKKVIQEEGIGSLAFIPLVSDGKLIGKFMTYYNALHVFSESELELSLTIARQLAVGIERKHAEEALRESEERFHAILRQATAGIVRKDAEGKLMFVNQAFCNMLGYTESELLGKTIWQLTHNDDLEENKRLYDRTMSEGTPFKLEKRLIRRDGSILWVDVSVSPIMDATGRPESAVAVEVDITGRKQAEEALRDLNIQLETRVQNRTIKLQEANQSLVNEIAERQKAEEALHESGKRLQILSQRLVEVQEEERRAIARELHDSVGQSLSALNINLVILDNQISNSANEQIRTRLNDSMQLTAETISFVRDVMSDLRPSVLDDYGLEAALQSYLDQFKSRYAIKVLFEKPDQPIRRLGSSIEMTFLRIAQEALLNIARHAHADQVNLSLGQNGNALRLIVEDNGSGIESWPEANRPGSHGLTIMRERADAVGGNLRVLSVPGKGTKVEVSIPVENRSPQTVQGERRE